MKKQITTVTKVNKKDVKEETHILIMNYLNASQLSLDYLKNNLPHFLIQRLNQIIT